MVRALSLQNLTAAHGVFVVPYASITHNDLIWREECAHKWSDTALLATKAASVWRTLEAKELFNHSTLPSDQPLFGSVQL